MFGSVIETYPLKVLVIHRFYWPDTPPYATMLRAIVRRWVGDGHDVDVLSSQPSYKAGVNNQKQPFKQVIDGANVKRLNLPSEAGRPLVRILNALKLGASIFWQGLVHKRYDVIMVSTSPPVLGGWFTALVARLSGARFIYHCMDIHPEIGRISGEFRNASVFSLLSRMDKWTCEQARPVVVLSEDMTNSLCSRSARKSPETVIINNFSLPSERPLSVSESVSWPTESFVLLFAGNIGRFQGLETLMEAMTLLRDRDDIRVLMMGEGTEKDKLEKIAKDAGLRVTFVGHQSVEVAKAAMEKASAGFVSLVPELYRYAYPSKTMSYLEMGCPVLVSVETNSRLARDVVGTGSGLAVESGNANLLANAIMSMADDCQGLELMRKNSQTFAMEAFAPDVVLDRWSSILSEK